MPPAGEANLLVHLLAAAVPTYLANAVVRLAVLGLPVPIASASGRAAPRRRCGSAAARSPWRTASGPTRSSSSRVRSSRCCSWPRERRPRAEQRSHPAELSDIAMTDELVESSDRTTSSRRPTASIRIWPTSPSTPAAEPTSSSVPARATRSWPSCGWRPPTGTLDHAGRGRLQRRRHRHPTPRRHRARPHPARRHRGRPRRHGGRRRAGRDLRAAEGPPRRERPSSSTRIRSRRRSPR